MDGTRIACIPVKKLSLAPRHRAAGKRSRGVPMSKQTVSRIAVVISLISIPAAAQEAAAPAPANGLEEIVVTAQKRSENLKEIPMAVSVLSGATLKESHIEGFEDITRAIPGVSFGAGGAPGLDNIEVRGVSSNSGSATVGI